MPAGSSNFSQNVQLQQNYGNQQHLLSYLRAPQKNAFINNTPRFQSSY
jgi:hypothetical protein